MKRSARAGPSRSNNAPPAAAGAPCKASPTSPSSSPTWTQPPNGDSTNSTPSANSSPPAHGYHPHSNQLNSYPTLPGNSRLRLPPTSPHRYDGRAMAVFHLHPKQQRLTAHVQADHRVVPVRGQPVPFAVQGGERLLRGFLQARGGHLLVARLVDHG